MGRGGDKELNSNALPQLEYLLSKEKKYNTPTQEYCSKES